MQGLSIERRGSVERRELPGLEGLVIGRGPGCDVVVDCDDVLPEHARLERTPDGLRVLALDSEPELEPGLAMWDLLEKIEPHVIAMNRLVGTYERS